MEALLNSIRSGNISLEETAIKELGTANVRDVFSGTTPLHEAAVNGNCEMIRLLVSKGANVNSTDNDSSSSPLGAAAIAGHLEACQLLQSLGAKLGAAESDIVGELIELGELQIAKLLSEAAGQ